MEQAHEHFRFCAESEEYTRSKSLEDWKFRVGDQWPDDIRDTRQQDGRPCLTMNRIPQFTSQVINEQRQQRPAIKVNPVGDGADKETAEIEQGIVRHIEVRSDAEIPRDTAFEQMVIGGRGHYRILTEYEGDGFEQEIRIAKIDDPFTVFTDPAAVAEGLIDAKFRFIIQDLTEQQYKDEFGSEEYEGLGDWVAQGTQAPLWFPQSKFIRIAEYYYIEEEKRTIYQLADGSIVDSVPQGKEWTNKREVCDKHVKWCKINGVKKLAEQDIVGDYIPVITVLGRQCIVEGRKHEEGLVRWIKDPQRQYNFFQSAATEGIALAPKAPWQIAEGQDEGYEKMWATANTVNYPTLKYKPVSLLGQPLPPPQRVTAEPPIQAMMMMVRQADLDLKNGTGLTDPNLGMSRADQSGEAVKALQSQGQVSNVNWADNLARSIRAEGKVLLGMIPKIYNTPRVMRIIDPDGTNRHVVTHNSQNGDGQLQDAQKLALAQGIQKIYDVSVGRYDIAVTVGPSYQTRRQEAAANMLELMKVAPQIATIGLDLLVGNMDFPGNDQLAERAKAILPPQVLQGDDPATKLAQAQAQLNQLGQQHQQAVQIMQQQHDIIQGKQVENAGKLEIEKLHSETQVAVAEITTKVQEPLMRLKYEFEMWKLTHGSAHDLGLQKDQQAHEQAQAQQAQQAAQQQQESAQAAEQQSNASAEPAPVSGG